MDQQQILSDAVRYSAKIAQVEDGWIQPLGEVVKGVRYEAAKWKAAPDVPSIWEIVAHAIPYTESRVADYTGEPRPNEEDWPQVTDTSEQAWKALQARVATAIDRLQSAVEAATDEQLAATLPGRDHPTAIRLVDIAIHDAYHAGQIVKLTQLYAATREPALAS